MYPDAGSFRRSLHHGAVPAGVLSLYPLVQLVPVSPLVTKEGDKLNLSQGS